MMVSSLSDSRFNMWRAVVAMIHADGVVTPHELDFVNKHISELNLSEGQLDVVKEDIAIAQDVYAMFALITDKQDKADFFVLARALSWCDGDLDKQEAHILKTLQAMDMTDSDKFLLKQSSCVVDEVELCDNQWRFKSDRSKDLLSFLNDAKAASF